MLRACILFLLASFLGLIIQSSVIHGTIPSAPVPDMILVLVVIIALKFRSVAGLIGVFTLGLLSDFASGQYVGPNAAGSLAVFGLVGAIVNRVYADRGLALMVIVFLCSLAKSTVVASMFSLFLENSLSQVVQFSVMKLMLLEALLSAVVAPLLLKLLQVSKPFPAGFRPAGSGSFRWE